MRKKSGNTPEGTQLDTDRFAEENKKTWIGVAVGLFLYAAAMGAWLYTREKGEPIRDLPNEPRPVVERSSEPVVDEVMENEAEDLPEEEM